MAIEFLEMSMSRGERRSNRKLKLTPKGKEYIAQVKKEQEASAKRLPTSYWDRSVPGDVIVDASITSVLTDDFLQNFQLFQESLKETRGYKAESEIEFDTDPKSKTPQKGVTKTPRRRNFKNTTTVRIEFLDKGEVTHKFRLVTLQEDKFSNNEHQEMPEFSTPSPIEKQNLNKLSDKLMTLLDEEDNSSIKYGKTLTKFNLTQGRKKRLRFSPEKKEDTISADEVYHQLLQDPDCPLSPEQKAIQMHSPHELSHMVARCHNGEAFKVPTTKGHNSKRIPIEILVPFFIRLGLKVEFETVDKLMRDKRGVLTLLPEKEYIIFTLTTVARRIIFELDPLCPEAPVNGCYDIAKNIAIMALSNTDYFEPAKTLWEQQQKRKASHKKAKYFSSSEGSDSSDTSEASSSNWDSPFSLFSAHSSSLIGNEENLSELSNVSSNSLD